MTTTKNNEHKKLKVPNIRFPEFQGEWEKCALENLSTEIGDGIHATPLYDDNGTYYFVNGNNISEYGITITPTTQRVTEAEAYRNNANILCSKTILLSINGTIGNVALYKGEPIMLGKSACYINVSTKVNKHYIFHYLMMPKCQFYFTSELTGTTIKNLSLKSVRRTKVSLPNLKEQNRIAQLFDAINERIVTQNKIIDKLKSLIKGISKQLLMNNQNWRTVRIGELLRIGNGKDYKHLGIGKIPVYGTGGQMLLVNDYLYDGESVCIGRKGTIDTPMFLKGKFWTVDTLFYTYDFKDVLPKFCYYLFLQINWKLYNEGTGVPSLSKSTIENIKVKIPSIEQQHNICSVLDCYEHKTKSEEQILELYLSEKQYLLRQMFI